METKTAPNLKSAEETGELPLIDMAPFIEGTPEGKARVAAQIKHAAEDLGFLYISNHGVPTEVIDAAFAASRRFFALPDEEKLAVKVNASHRGFIPMNNSTYEEGLLPNTNESFLIGRDWDADSAPVRAGTPLHGPNQWPDLDGFREPIETYFNALNTLGFQLLRACAIALELPEDFFEPRYDPAMPFIRLLHYPAVPGDRPDNQFGIAPHTDYGCLTILAQDRVSGLQVMRRGGGWIDARTKPGTFIVNIGDMLMRWTNDKWISTPHRVISNTATDRYSIPFFFDPAYHTVVSCIDSCLAPGDEPKYEPITWGDYLTMRFDKTYDYRGKKKS